MTGLLDGYGIDMDEIEAPSYEVPDDIYEFEVSDFFLQDGTDNWPDRRWLVIQYALGAKGKSKSEWFELPENPAAPTDKELLKLGYYKNRLRDLGIQDSQMNSVGPDDILGKTGTLQVATKNGFQNIKNVRLETDSAGNAFAAKPAETAAAPAGRRKSAPKAAPVAVPEEVEQGEDAPEEVEEAPVQPGVRRVQANAETKARDAGVKANPFR